MSLPSVDSFEESNSNLSIHESENVSLSTDESEDSSDLSSTTTTSESSNESTTIQVPQIRGPNIRLRAMGKLQLGEVSTPKSQSLSSASSQTPSSESSQTQSSDLSSVVFNQFLSTMSQTSIEDGSDETYRQEPSTQSLIEEKEDVTTVKAIRKTKWFAHNLAEACEEATQTNENIETAEERITKLLQDLQVRERLKVEDVCREVNKQRLQTDQFKDRQDLVLASVLVDFVIQEAKAAVCKQKPQVNNEDMDTLMMRKLKVRWPTIAEFSVSEGGRRIREYIQYWDLDPRWGYSVDLLDIREDSVSRYFIYNVQFCIPTISRPIPTLSVTLYFIYQISKLLPRDYPVTVSFVIEGRTRQHYVRDVDKLEEKWLLHVMEMKEQILKQIQF